MITEAVTRAPCMSMMVAPISRPSDCTAGPWEGEGEGGVSSALYSQATPSSHTHLSHKGIEDEREPRSEEGRGSAQSSRPECDDDVEGGQENDQWQLAEQLGQVVG